MFSRRQNAVTGRFSGGFTPYGGGNGSSSSFGPWLNNGGFAHGGGSVVANSTSYPNAASYAGDFGERGVGGMPIGYAGEGGVPVYASGYGAANYASMFSQYTYDMLTSIKEKVFPVTINVFEESCSAICSQIDVGLTV